MLNDNAKASAISAGEAQLAIESLQRIGVSDVADDRWIKQHGLLERFNMQAHYNVSTNAEEFITEAFLTFDKTSFVIYDLLVTETWKSKIFPLLYRDVAHHASLMLYFVLFHEAVLVNLLEIMMYNKEICLSCGDMLLDLTDYCSRKIGLLNLWVDEERVEQTSSDTDLLSTHNNEEVMQIIAQKKALDLSIALTSLSIVRYLTEYITALPLSVITRILNTNDIICALVYLLESAPWKIKTKQSNWKLFNGTSWIKIDNEDQFLVGSIEGQVWLALYNLLVEPECQRNYEWTDYRHSTVIRLKKQFEQNNTLLDQIPPLEALLRYLEHLTIMTPSANALVNRGLLVEEIPQVFEGIQQCQNWVEISRTQARTVFSENAARQITLAKSLASVYDFSGLDDLLEDPKCSRCGTTAEQRCSRCQLEWYCSRVCQVKAWKGHKKLCDLVVENSQHQRPQEEERVSTVKIEEIC